MRFETSFEVPGTSSEVIKQFADVPTMASLIQGASVGPVQPDGSYPGALVVTFGPKRISFKGTIANQVDLEAHSGILIGQGSADLRAARMAVKMNYSLNEDKSSSSARTKVTIVSEARLTGVLAEFAKTGGVVVTDAILAEFVRRFTNRFSESPAASPLSAAPSDALSAATLAWNALRSVLRSLAKFFGKHSGSTRP